MDNNTLLENLKNICVSARETFARTDEVYIETTNAEFGTACNVLHKILNSPVVMEFAEDGRLNEGCFTIYCAFLNSVAGQWVFVKTNIKGGEYEFPSLAKEIYSASLFEREIKEMFGITPLGHPDLRRLRLHDEVWPEGFYPLRKDFSSPGQDLKASGEYAFTKVEGEGVFEIPVGPVHAGIIGPGHFRFSAAGEPIINLELRLGFTHRGAEKIFERRDASSSINISECISGDSAFSHSLAFSKAVEKIYGISIPYNAELARGIFLELERIYNHVSDMGGMALDVGFSFVSAYASVIKEKVLALNKELTGKRYLKNVNIVGGVKAGIDGERLKLLSSSLDIILKDFSELKKMLLSSISFMDRVETTGILKKKTAVDLGVLGLAGRASGIPTDLRNIFYAKIYKDAAFLPSKRSEGDCLARLKMRFDEFEESVRLIRAFIKELKAGGPYRAENIEKKSGYALGYAEGWRGPVLYWLKVDASGAIERCKIVDPSFNNWQALSYAVLGNIVPDFPLCNKSFDLSYSGNDL